MRMAGTEAIVDEPAFVARVDKVHDYIPGCCRDCALIPG